MRSICLVFERSLTESISELLDMHYGAEPAPVKRWLVLKDNDPCLYIDNEPFSKNEVVSFFEDEDGEIKIPAQYSQMRDPVVWMVEISGWHAGTTEVLELAELLLTEFPMYLMDDYTNHFWTLEDIKCNKKIEGHCFFDYKGWYKEKNK